MIALRPLKPRVFLVPEKRSDRRWTLVHQRVDLVAIGGPEDLPGRAGRDRHVHGVAGQAEHRDLLGDRVDRDDDQGVGVEGAVARTLVGPDQQDVEAFLAVPRRDRHLGQGRPDGRAGRFGRRGRLGRAGLGRGRRQAGRRRRRVEIAFLGRVAQEDAAAVEEALGQDVVAGDHHVAAGHDQDDRQETGEREGIASAAGPPGAAVTRGRGGVQVVGDPVRVDDRDQAVEEDAEVDDEDGVEDGRVDEEAEEGDLVEPEDHPGAQREGQDRGGREGQGAQGRTGVELAESGKDQREEGRGEWRPRARSRALRFVHRG